MGWSTNLVCNIEFNKQTYNKKHEVEREIEKCEEMINTAKEELKMLAFMTEPSKFCGKDEAPEYYIKERLEDWLEILEDNIIESYKLHKLLYNWDKCHNKEGLAIEPPKRFKYDTAYLNGDFVFTNKHPTQENIFGYELDHKGNVVSDENAIVDKDGKFKKIEPTTIEELNSIRNGES